MKVRKELIHVKFIKSVKVIRVKTPFIEAHLGKITLVLFKMTVLVCFCLFHTSVGLDQKAFKPVFFFFFSLNKLNKIAHKLICPNILSYPDNTFQILNTLFRTSGADFI